MLHVAMVTVTCIHVFVIASRIPGLKGKLVKEADGLCLSRWTEGSRGASVRSRLLVS